MRICIFITLLISLFGCNKDFIKKEDNDDEIIFEVDTVYNDYDITITI